MSCIAKIKSPVTGQPIISPAYYQLTSFFNQAEGKRIYQATTSNTFKTNFGFDWTKPQIGYSEKVNYAGEPKMREINKHLNLGMSELELRSAEQIEEIGALGYIGKQFKTESAFDNILFEVQLNPKFDMINAEVISVGNQFQLSVKPVVGDKVEGVISKDMLTRYKFPEFVVNGVKDFNNTSFKELVDNLAQSKDVEPFQKEMLEKLSPLIGKNTKLKLAVFDDFNIADEFQRSFYDPKTNTVFIAKSVTTPVNNQFLVREIIHEAVHAFTIEVLNNPKNAVEVQFVQEMQQYFNTYSTYYSTLNGEYGLKNIEEFVSEFLSNPYFRQTLQDEELRRSKSVGIIDRMWNSIKNFLNRYVFGNLQSSMFDQVQETLDDYFDYLATLQDFPQTQAETQVRFSQPFSQRQQKPEIYNRLKNFYDYVDQTVTGKVWGQLAQSFQEASPEFNSIRAIQDKFGLISTSNIADSLKASVSYVEAIKQLLEKVERDLDTAIKGQNYYESEKLLSRYNSILVIAETFEQQLKYFKNNLVDQLSFDILLDFSEEQRRTVAEEKIKLKSEESYIESIRNDMKKEIEAAQAKVASLKNKAQDNMVLPVAQVAAKMFSKIANDMQKPEHPIQKEKAELEERLARVQDNPRLEKKLKAELDDIEKALSFAPTVDNIKKLLNAANDQSLRYTSVISKYFAVGGQTGVPIVDIVNAFVNNHVTEATNRSLAVDTQIRDIQDRINKRNRRKGIGRNLLNNLSYKTSAMGEFYKGFFRVVPIKYYQDGKLRVISQKVYNTPMKEAEFQNDLADLTQALTTARNYGTEAELKEAQANLDQFVKDYAQREFVDEYYEAEELLTDEAREARQELRTEIDQIASVFGDEDLDLGETSVVRGSNGEPEPTTRELRAKLRRQYVRLGSIYNEDGSEKPVGSKERRIADSIIAYNKARKALDVVEFVISDDTLVKFTQIRNQFKTNVSTIQADIAQLQSTLDAAQIANDLGLIDSTAAKIDQKREELKAEKEREKKWLEQNTRIEILPEFFEAQQALSDKIRDVLSKYGENPEVTEKYERLFSAVRGYRDQDGVIEGTLVGEGLTKTIQELEQEIEDLKKDIKESQDISEEDKATLKGLFTSLYQLQTKTNTSYYYETANGIKDKIQFSQEEKATIKQRALDEANYFQENGGNFKTSNLFYAENFEPNDYFMGRTQEDFDPTNTDINDLTAMFENLITAVERNKKYRQTDWYKNNHIAITYEVKSGNQVILPNGTIQDQMIERTEMRPIYIWRKTVPSNEKYIKRESPTFDWAVPRIREEYKNKDHRFLGDYRPRQNAKDDKYVNPEYEALDSEEKEIMNDILKIYEEEQRVLPTTQRLKGYVMPNMGKESKEESVDLYKFHYKVYYWWRSLKVFFKENIPNVGEEDEIGMDIINAQKQYGKSNVRLIKTRFKEPLSDIQSTDNILGALSAFSVYAAEFHGLRKALPAVFAIRDRYAQNAGVSPGRDTTRARTVYQKFKKGVKSVASIVTGATAEQQQELILDQIENQISRFFYGAQLKTGGNQATRVLARSSTRILSETQKYALKFNLMRMPKNVVANVLNATGNRNKFGLSKQDMLNGIAKAAKHRADLIGLEQGLNEMTPYLAKLIYFRAIPMADPTQLFRSINSSFTMRYLTADSLNAQWFSSNEAISTLGIYEAMMAKTFVPYIDSLGIESSILLADAYDYIDGQLIFKEGVMGIDRTKLNQLAQERNQYIIDFLGRENVNSIQALSPVKQVQLNKEIKAKFEVPIKAQEKFIGDKITELKKIEQEVRDKIFSLYTATQGNYMKRGASYYESVIALKFLMSMKRWLYPSLKNYYGGKSFNVITGTLDQGFYSTFINALRKKLSSLRVQSNQLSMDYYMTEREKAAAQRVAINLGNTAVLYITTRLLATLAMAMIGDDDEEDGALEWIISLLALMSLGSLDEYGTVNPIIGPTTFYNKLKTDPLKKGYEEKGFFDSFFRSATYAWFGQQTRALDQMLEGFGIIGEGVMDIATGTSPVYLERSRQGKGGEVPNPRVPFYQGRSKFLVGASKASGVELLIKSAYPGKKLEQLTKFTPIVGMPNPQGRLNMLLKDIDALSDKLTTRTNEDILNVSDLYIRNSDGTIKKTFDKKGKPIYEYDKEKLKSLNISTRDADDFAEIVDKLLQASLERDKLINTYPSLRAYEENLRAAQAEGREASKTTDKILFEFTGYEKPKFEVSEEGKDIIEINRATQSQYRKAVKRNSENIKKQLEILKDESAAEIDDELLPE